MSIELKGALAGACTTLSILGCVLVLTASQTPAASKTKTASSVQSGQIMKGAGYYTQSCVVCHGVNGIGGEGPRLAGLTLPDAQIARTIKEGIKGDMPSFGNRYHTPEIAALTAYLHSLKH